MATDMSFVILVSIYDPDDERKRPTFFEIQGEEEVYIASLARWNAQWRGLVELERCRDTMQEVTLLSERQDILKKHDGRQA